MTTTFGHLFGTFTALAPFLGSATLRAIQPGPRLEESASPTLTPPWNALFAVRIQDIGDLRPGWDGPGSVVPSTDTLAKGRLLTFRALDGISNAVPPYVVPAGDGSIQLEWHEVHGELELLITPDGMLSAWLRDHHNEIELEGDGEKALALFYRWAPWLAAVRRDAADVPIQANAPVLELAA